MIVLHIDFDSFFASVEQQANPFLRGKPIGVTGSSLTKGVVCSASIKAKKHGVKTGMPLFEAKKLCPHIIPIKGDFTKYQYIHNKSLEIFNKYTNLVEPFSIDEAFIDITDTVKLYGSPEIVAFNIKEDVFSKFGPYITCSIGIGPNKLLAKLVSDFNKPNGLFVITKNNLQDVLASAKLTDFCGLGPRLNDRLKTLNVFTVEDLQKIDAEILYKNFGNAGSNFLKNLSFGIDKKIVQNIEFCQPVKSISHQHTLSKNTKDNKIVEINLARLSEMVGRRLRKQGMLGKTIAIYLKDSKRAGYQARTTLSHYVDSGKDIYLTTKELLERLSWKKETRLVGVNISNLVPKDQTTLPMFKEQQQTEKLTKAADLINNKFGEFTLIPAVTLKADKTKGKISSFLKHN